MAKTNAKMPRFCHRVNERYGEYLNVLPSLSWISRSKEDLMLSTKSPNVSHR